MGILDHDTAQKEKAIRYCVSNGLLPYLEVVVGNTREITDVKSIITDLDVLGIEISRRGVPRKTLFDCKTVGKMSAINRAFWASGVMSYLACDEAYVILSKKATEAHRLSARAINVHLFQEQDFDAYAQSANINYLDKQTYSYDIGNWHSYYSLFEKYQNLKPLGEHINTKLPLETDHARGLRELLGAIRASKGEFDPDKQEHMAIYCSLIMSFILVMAPVTSQIADVFEPGMLLEDYEKALRYYIWGGRETYILRRDLKNAVLETAGGSKAELELPGWHKFVQTSRIFLDAPTELREALIPCRELSLRCLAGNDSQKDRQLNFRIKESNRSKQFMIASSDYICESASLPKDIHQKFKQVIFEVEDSATNP